MKALLGALLLAGCAGARPPAPVCVTACGMLTAAGRCEELKKQERRIVRELGGTLGLTRADVCEALKGWTVEVHRHDDKKDAKCSGQAWLLSPGFCALGYTHIDTRVVEVGDDRWETNALAHELVHVADFAALGHAGHCLWQHRGVKDALERLTGVPDWTPPEKSCVDSK